MKDFRQPALVLMLVMGVCAFRASGQTADSPTKNDGSRASDAGAYVKVELSQPVKMAKLKAGDKVEGKLSRDVYSAERKVFSAGSPVRLVVDHLEKRKRIPNDHWPWVVKVLTPRRENYPVFKNATIIQADGGEVSLEASLVSISRVRELRAKKEADKSGTGAATMGGQSSKTPTIVLEAFGLPNENSSDVPETGSYPENGETLPAGTHCRVLLLTNVSAAKNNVGDTVAARLLEPVYADSKLALPAGTSLEGKIAQKTPPRWLSRSGSLYLVFSEATLPNGNRLPLAASLAGAELDQRSHTRMDAEGKLHGERPGRVWMAINLGMTAGIAKEVDDGTQLIIEALVTTATDASTAGMARIVSSCISGLYMATRHGRDVVLPRFTELELLLDRPLTVAPVEIKKTAVATGGLAPGSRIVNP